jgi:hypothetical protein
MGVLSSFLQQQNGQILKTKIRKIQIKAKVTATVKIVCNHYLTGRAGGI